MDKYSVVDNSKKKLVDAVDFSVDNLWHLTYLYKEAKKAEKIRELILAYKDLYYQKKEIFNDVERIINE